MYADRITRIQTALEGSPFDAIALIPGTNLLYLTGLNFHLMERPVVALFAPNAVPRFILPELEQDKLSGCMFEHQAFAYSEDAESRITAFRKGFACFKAPAPKIGVEPFRMRYYEINVLKQVLPGIQLSSADGLLSSLRLLKNTAEIDAMQRAAQVAEKALLETLALIKPGVTETAFESELTLQLIRAGSDSETAFSPIVASGPNSALPHATPTTRAFTPGDLVIVDWGARVDGYISDISRTFAFAEPDPELEQIHAIVHAANAAGREQVRPGNTCAAPDDAARAVIESAGYGKYFMHRTGHGIGMEAHEPPYILAGNTRIQEAGMTFTIEPGIYLKGKGGVRIEDDVVVTVDGHRCLTTLPRELKVIP
ncbi:MAG: aminopeptidase P family protein [Anaerolineales bacterium]|nr:aminopeptidase P family protein [Anaerolineales bacterium]